jgi:hypothetical protein
MECRDEEKEEIITQRMHFLVRDREIYRKCVWLKNK